MLKTWIDISQMRDNIAITRIKVNTNEKKINMQWQIKHHNLSGYYFHGMRNSSSWSRNLKHLRTLQAHFLTT